MREGLESGGLLPPHTMRRNAAPPAPDAARGLRQLSLPTVGATQAAADAAAAARRGESHTSLSPEGSETFDAQRMRYFRRLSALPPQPLDVPPVPTPMLKFLDAARGVLFALSQIYNALKQHISVSNDERLIAHFQRVLHFSGLSMNALISALDRLDTASQLGVPEPQVVRGVLDTCSESLRTFRRAISMVQSQLPQLEESVDVRFSRTLLLMLYGSMAELRNSGAIMAPNASEMAQYLAQDAPSHDDDTSWHRLRGGRRMADASFETTAESLSEASVSPISSTPLPKRHAHAKAGSLSLTRSPRGVSPRESRKPHVSPRIPGTPSPSVGVPQLRLRTPSLSHREMPTIDAQLQSTLQQVTAQAVHVWTDLHEDLQAAHPETDENVKRLRDVDDTCKGTLEQTRRLQATLARLPDDLLRMRPPTPECQQLWEEANHFVRVGMPLRVPCLPTVYHPHLHVDQSRCCTLSLPARPHACRRRAQPGLFRARRRAPRAHPPCVDHVIARRSLRNSIPDGRRGGRFAPRGGCGRGCAHE